MSAPRPAPAFGPWRSAVVTDTGRPLGRPFTLWQRVYWRETLGADPDAPIHLLRPGGGRPGAGSPGVRRWLTETQLDGATNEHAADVPQRMQGSLSAEWDALEPPDAGCHPGTRIPRRWKGLDVRLTADNPEVKGPGWQGDTVAVAAAPPNMALIVERAFWVTPPAKPPPEEDERQICDLLEHEAVELAEKGRLVDSRWPRIGNDDRARCLDEMEGPAHAATIGTVEGYYGPDAERRYLVELDYRIARQRGFGKLVDQWERTDV